MCGISYSINLYTEQIFRHIINMNGVNVGGKNDNNLRYADDTILRSRVMDNYKISVVRT